MHDITAPTRRASQQRRHRVRVAALVAGLSSILGLAAAAPAGAAGAATVPAYKLGVASITLAPNGSASVPVLFSAARRGTIQWTVQNLPAGVSSTISCSTARRCDIAFRAAANVAQANATAVVVFSAGAVKRSASLAISIPTGTPTPTPTTAPAPTTAVPTTAAPTSPKSFTLRTGLLVTTTAPGGDVAFPLQLVRDNWLGGIALTVDSLPSGWRAAFLPSNPAPQESVQLIVSVPSNAANGDYPVRMHASSATARADATLVVRVRTLALSLTLTSAPAVGSTGTAQFLVDVRPLDDSTLPITMGVEGLPAGVTAAFSSNPAVGLVALNITVPSTVASGSYAFTIVASRTDVSQRIAAVLTVPVRVGATFLPTATGATGTPGYSLSATPGSANVVAGGSVSFDVTVTPLGSFGAPINVAMSVPAGWGVGYVGIAANVFRVTVTAPTGTPLGTVSLPLLTSSGTLTASLTLSATVVSS